MNKKEPGHGGIVYATGFVCIVIMYILMAFLQFNWDIYVIAEQMETALHISESAVLSANQASVSPEYGDNGEYIGSNREDDELVGNETARFHILTSINVEDTNTTEDEIRQLNHSWNVLKTSLGENLDTSFIKSYCKDISIGEFIIYEPVYKTTVENKIVDGKIVFNVNYKIVSWIRYTCFLSNTDKEFTQQTISGIKKDIIEEENIHLLKMNNGESPEGATIEATLYASFSGVNNIFAKAGDVTNTGFFSNNPHAEEYRVYIRQQMDIVIAEQDNRKQ